ncbi:Xaa-Pro peptidase family protein [Enterococcus hulanensis]|uniref:Xaa-Pro peptidase family protein n=1 Tax=Enterococcus hulanensis TaxID=2559929 RepID=A0ABU3EZ49_9ENTE|nr:Xaa-Pro peptidase family protein [Enterococcus hulanensis]MDT2599221.1 Xaa-Pro peptidase family protein [Enterococcus hulanensis]MDT2608628.1 Xaa-Pro peptidase family protein [Enterococcus hulanensis]MDT2616383.1 Xaa-Pro peptidase family protein [Enterococcus hulanensis]MDT2627577.1 Xaa-Pro peptidase family protein [Enterococcus hulanensis]MDT2655607.1 Xaa-Pro peptidase family protein [Enterococcus hulanensis]
MIKRIEKLRALMKKEVIDAYLVTSPANLRYLTNFTGTAGLAFITLEKAFFITDFRYTEQAGEQVQAMTIVQQQGDVVGEIIKLMESEGINVLGFEDAFMTYAEYSVFEEVIDAELAPASGLIETLREQKDDGEIAIIEKACTIADEGFEHVLKMIRPGMTEIEVANQLDFFMRSLGATGTSFDTIVASGVRSALPHGVASTKTIEQGDLITLDFGCVYQGYVSDITRTFAIGDPGQQLKDIYQIVLEAQQKVIDVAQAGVTGAQLDAIARDFITEAGYGEAFGHSTGHGIGMEIHEGPNITRFNDEPLKVGSIITDEPGIYVAGLGGVRIEDDLVILADGNRILTHSPKELIII